VTARKTCHLPDKLAGVSPATISRTERGRAAGLSIALAERILAALELRLDIQVVPPWADIDEAIEAVARMPVTERIETWPFSLTPFASRLDGIPATTRCSTGSPSCSTTSWPSAVTVSTT
jgi:transcriptional regulator with XRE-family HTH domain